MILPKTQKSLLWPVLRNCISGICWQRLQIQRQAAVTGLMSKHKFSWSAPDNKWPFLGMCWRAAFMFAEPALFVELTCQGFPLHAVRDIIVLAQLRSMAKHHRTVLALASNCVIQTSGSCDMLRHCAVFSKVARLVRVGSHAQTLHT